GAVPEVRGAVPDRAHRPRRQDHPAVHPGGVRLQAGSGSHGRVRSRPDPSAMNAAVGSFLEYLGVERGASPHTLRSYATDLTEFTSFLAAEKIDGLPSPHHPAAVRVL